MKVISAADATVLALIAENPRMSDHDLHRLMARLSPEAQEIASAIVRLSVDQAAAEDMGDPIRKTASAILNWVRGNKRRGTAVSIPA